MLGFVKKNDENQNCESTVKSLQKIKNWSFIFLAVSMQGQLQVVNLPTGGTCINNSITSRSLSIKLYSSVQNMLIHILKLNCPKDSLSTRKKMNDLLASPNLLENIYR